MAVAMASDGEFQIILNLFEMNLFRLRDLHPFSVKFMVRRSETVRTLLVTTKRYSSSCRRYLNYCRASIETQRQSHQPSDASTWACSQPANVPAEQQVLVKNAM